MEENNNNVNEDIFSKVMRAGRRTYFFDVRSTKAGDYYLTISESKKFTNEDGTFYFKKHKIYLYKEDFQNFSENLAEMTKYIVDEKGSEVISEIHDKDFKAKKAEEVVDDKKLDEPSDEKTEESSAKSSDSSNDIFEDI
tara:strand:+ start:547 stop:963 length:417 start_codon:yes stop_codon:yes gene_type:complete